MHIAHTTPYRLAKPPSSTDITIRMKSLKTSVKKECNGQMVEKNKQFDCAGKWISNGNIHHKLSNSLWKTPQTTYAQIAQILKFKYAQYIGDHMLSLFWHQKFTNPYCTLCYVTKNTHGCIYYLYAIINSSNALGFQDTTVHSTTR